MGESLTIEFEVEDGTGKETSTSYLSVDELKQFALNEGVDLTVLATDELAQQYLNRYTVIIDAIREWPGVLLTTTQALSWPRKSAYDINGNIIDSASVPKEIKKAVFLAVKYSLAGVDLIPVKGAAGDIAEESVSISGAVSESKKYVVGSSRMAVVIPEIDYVLKKISGSGNSYNLKLGRA